jgi:PmbA protein
MSIQNKAEQIMNLVRTAGAAGDLIVDEGQSLSLKAREGELEEYKVSSSQVFGLRVIKDGRVGTAYSEASDVDALSSMVEQALVNATFAAADRHEKILANTGSLKTDDALLHPEDATEIEEKIELALNMERGLSKKDRVKNVPYNGVQDNSGERRVFTSAGLSAHSRVRQCACYAYALVEDGEKNAMEGAGQSGRLFADLNGDELIEKVHKNCLDILDGVPVPSKHYDIIFNDESQNAVFGVFAFMFGGKSAKDGVNPMRDKVGEVIADSRLTIYDNPLLVDGFGYTLFDAEGTATGKTSLIIEGKLESLIHNSATASFFGVETTGHGSRGPKSTLGVSLHQMEIMAGEDNAEGLLSGKYLELTDLTGLHSGANPISGDFSFGASGFLCRDGERVQPVRGVTVAGNFYEMLKKISKIGDTQRWDWEKGTLSPSIRFADVAISG